MTVAPLDDVERRILAHLPRWHSPLDISDAIRIETEGHSDEEIDHLLKNPSTEKSLIKQFGALSWSDQYGNTTTIAPDPREGTEPDPASFGSGDPRIVQGAGYSVQSYTADELLDRIRRDDFFSLYLAKRVIESGAEAKPLNVALIKQELGDLQARGLVAPSGLDHWVMTEAGFEALTDNSEVQS